VRAMLDFPKTYKAVIALSGSHDARDFNPKRRWDFLVRGAGHAATRLPPLPQSPSTPSCSASCSPERNTTDEDHETHSPPARHQRDRRAQDRPLTPKPLPAPRAG
jgi:hypothetical protein